MSSKYKKFLIFLAVFNLIFSLFMLLSGQFTSLERVSGIASLLTVPSVIGILKYKKWGVYLYFIGSTIAILLYIILKVDPINYSLLAINLLLIYPVKKSWNRFEPLKLG